MNKGCFYIIFLLVGFFAKSLYGQVVINEVSNANSSVIYDENEEANDWIELYNTSFLTVNLANYSLTDDSTDLTKWVFPNVSIAPLSHTIIFASGKDTLGNFLHTNFKLSSKGEKIILSDANGNIVDQYYLDNLQNNHSVGRKPDGSVNWCLFDDPSPDAANNNSTCYEGYEVDPIFSLNAGFYAIGQVVELYSPSPTGIVRYTLDGGFPSGSSSEYSSPITVNNTKVISARSFSTGNRLPGKTVKRTYFINEEGLDLPVFSITLDPSDLWDYNTGMYVMGPDASPVFPYEGANFWKKWDKVCHVEYFDKQKLKQFELNAELQIHGGRSRAFPQKSFRVIARKKYGENRMEYPMIPAKSFINSFKSINLRNGGQEYAMSRIRDAFMGRILKNTHADYIAYEPVIVFLNGEYWGIYGLRERQDKHYIESNHDIPSEQVDVIKHRGNKIWAQAGSTDEFYTMHDIITLSDPGKSEYYDNCSKALDLENFVDYFLSQIYYGNDDWIDHTTPCNNIRFWCPQKNGGRWRYAHFDLDKGLGGKGRVPETNNLAMVHNPIGPNVHSDMLRTLLKNTTFRHYFINRYADIMNTVFQPGNMEKIAFEMRDELKPFMHQHFSKWDGNYDKWLSEIDEMLLFNIKRLPIARQHIQEEFSLQKQVNVTLTTSPSEAGRIKISTIIPDSLPWAGVYFDGVPVAITAIPNPGFTFEYWGTNGNISNPDSSIAITLNISSDDIFTAYFSGSAVEPKLAFSEINYHSAPLSDAGDWVELYNYGSTSVNLTGWNIKDDNNTNKFEIPFGTVIPPNGYLVFSCDTQKFITQYPGVSNYTGQLPFNFKNSSDQVRLIKYDNTVFLSVTYSDSPPWPAEPDGTGRTLELKDPEVNPDLASNWFAGCPGGSPGKGYDPACLTEIPEAVHSNSFQLHIWPNPSRDHIRITILSNSEDLSGMSFSMYNFIGKEVKKISSLKGNEIVITRDEFNTGIYIIKVGNERFFLTEKIIFQ